MKKVINKIRHLKESWRIAFSQIENPPIYSCMRWNTDLSALLCRPERVKPTSKEDKKMKDEMFDAQRSLIMIISDGQLIKETNYWDTLHAERGLFFMSGNAGAWRLLVPDMHKPVLAEMATAKVVEIELGFKMGHRVVTIWFDDKTPTPFQLCISTEQMDRGLLRDKKNQPLFVYTRDGLQQKHIIRKVI